MIIIQVAGRLGADAESRFTPNGQKVTTLRLAVNIRKSGREETVWWRVTIWGDRFDKLLPYLKKGSGIIVIGEMGKPEIYTDKEGRPQVSLELTAEMIRFSPFGKDEKSEGQGAGNQSQSNPGSSGQGSSGQAAYSGTSSSFGAQSDFGDDSVPF